MNFFEDQGAHFSDCKKYRYLLWRIWDKSKPLIMFIGLNPSTANDSFDDNTIQQVRRISRKLGYGGFYMANCFPYISTDPDKLNDVGKNACNDLTLYVTSLTVKDIVFAWGNFKIVVQKGRDTELSAMFPNALALKLNKNGSPMHPLFVPATVQPVKYSSYGKP